MSWAVNLCSNPDDKLQIYRDNFEKAYMDSTERFYRTQAPAYLQQNGVQNYMKYVSNTPGPENRFPSFSVYFNGTAAHCLLAGITTFIYPIFVKYQL